VLDLVRVSIGDVKLGKLPLGAYRPLTAQEVRSLKRLVGLTENRTSLLASSETAASKTKDAKEEKAPKTQKVQKKPKKARISKEEPAENAVSPEAGKDDLVQEIPPRDPQVLDPQSQGIQEAPASADALYEAWKAEMDVSGAEK